MKLECPRCHHARKFVQVAKLGKNDRFPEKAAFEWKCPECGADYVVQIRMWEKDKAPKSVLK